MANDLSAVIPTIFAQGLKALREYCVMPRLINSSYSTDALQQGKTVNIPVPSAISVVDVAPSAYAPDPGNAVPTTATITLDNWREAPFYMTDQDIKQSVSGVIPGQISEAIRALSNDVNAKILALYKGVYGYAGTAGTVPFAVDLAEAIEARRVLGVQLAPTSDRRIVLDPAAEAKAINLRPVQDASQRASAIGIVEGQIGRLLGFDWYMDQQVPTHTKGAATSGTIALDDSAARAVGVKTLHMDGFSVKPSVGDVFTIAGDSQTYTVTASTTLAGTDSDVSFLPGLKVAIPAVDGNEVVTFKASHTVNLAFQRDAFGFASRLLDDVIMSDGDRQNIMAVADPVSGLALRLEVRRENKRTRWSFDLLFGCGVVRPELACRIAG